MIELRGIAKNLNGVTVLQNLNLTIETGETMAIIGCSGCGKTVTLKLLIGLMKPDKGRIIIDGEDITDYSEKEFYFIRKRFGMLFQMSALFDSMTVGENVGLGLRELSNFTEVEIAQKVAQKLELVGLPGIEGYMPASLSGGMKKRVGLARALATEPDIIIYDEPTTGLDPIMADIINRLIYDLKQEFSLTSIVVTHDLITVSKVADRVAMLHQGEVMFLGTYQDLQESTEPVVRQFIEGSAKGPIKPPVSRLSSFNRREGLL